MGTLTHGTGSWSTSETQTSKSKTYTFNTKDKYSDGNIALTVTAQSGSATTPTASAASTSTSLSGTTLTVARSVTPTVSAGWVANGTAGTVTITGTVPTQEKTAYPSSADQTINPDTGKLLSKVTVKGVTATNLTAANIKSGVTISVSNGNGNIYSVTGTYNNEAHSAGTISVNQSLPSGKTSSGTINRGTYIKIGAGAYNEDKYYLAQGDAHGNIGFSNISLTTSDKSTDRNYIPIVTTAGASATQWSNALTIPTLKTYSVTLTAGSDTSNRTILNVTHNNNTYISLNGTSTTDTFALINPGKAIGNIYLGNWTAESRTTRGYAGAVSVLGYGTNTSYPDYIGTLNIGTSTTNKNAQIGTINNYGTIGTLAQTGTISTVSGDQTITNVSGTLRVGNNAVNGTVTVNAYNDAATPALTGAKTIVSNGKWTKTSLSATSSTGNYYGWIAFTKPGTAAGSVTMTKGNGSCAYDSTNSANVTVSDSNTSGVKVQFTGSGSVSATAKITTAGYTAVNDSFATGASTSSNSASAAKYITKVSLSAGKYIQVADTIYTWTWNVDSNGNVSIY